MKHTVIKLKPDSHIDFNKLVRDGIDFQPDGNDYVLDALLVQFTPSEVVDRVQEAASGNKLFTIIITTMDINEDDTDPNRFSYGDVVTVVHRQNGKTNSVEVY